MAAPIYLDHAATTPLRPEVRDAMEPFFGPRFGNPSSTHRWGRDARAALDEARERLARCLGARSEEVCFTSGGTEGDNFAILGAWRAARGSGRNAIVTSPTEHKAVLAAVHHAAHEGAEARILTVDARGVIDDASFATHVRDNVAVCSIMWVNNETGVIQPLPELAARAKAVGAVVHTDAVQAFGKVPIDVRTLQVDTLTLSGHKIGAPKGIGALFIRRGTALEPLLHGGSQDRGRRPGTENVAFAVGLAVAAELTLAEQGAEQARVGALRDRLEAALLARVPDLVVHGRGAPRAHHVVSVSVPGIDSEAMLMALDLRGVAASGGSACQSGSADPSYVLCAMGVAPDLASSVVRLSLGTLTTAEEIDRVIELFPALVEKARATAPSW